MRVLGSMTRVSEVFANSSKVRGRNERRKRE